MLKLKLQYFGHLMGRTDSLEKTLMLGKFEGGKVKEESEKVGLNFNIQKIRIMASGPITS